MIMIRKGMIFHDLQKVKIKEGMSKNQAADMSSRGTQNHVDRENQVHTEVNPEPRIEITIRTIDEKDLHVDTRIEILEVGQENQLAIKESPQVDSWIENLQGKAQVTQETEKKRLPGKNREGTNQ